jgi:hypothetical protein
LFFFAVEYIFRRRKVKTRKTFNLVVEIVGGVSAIAIGAVTYFGVPYATAINSSIEVVATAVITVCNNFVKD